MSAIAAPRVERRRLGVSVRALPRPELVALLALGAVLDLVALDRNGWSNAYYSAAVRSMSSSWHAFLYGSFDAGGLMTVDKPPLALWVQALSARVFGFHPLSALIPQAAMGVATVALVYDLTRRRFGRAAGFVAGLVLALTPMTVAISRHNNPDALLVLCCAAALWCVVRALEDGRTRWILLAGVCAGLGFEAKMAVALMVVPGIAAAWLWVAPRGRVAAVRQLLAGGGAMVAVGGAWPLLVALTPASRRPWISGTSDNSIVSLIFGYNGFGRLGGQAGGPQAFGGGGGPGGGGPFGEEPGAFRLLNDALGAQAGWLLGFAVAGAIGVLVASRLRRSDPRTGWLLAVGGAFATTALTPSAAKGIFHPYYVSLLAPFTAALVGATATQLVRGDLLWRIVAPLAIAGGVTTELVVLHDNPSELQWLSGLLGAGGTLAALALATRGTPPRARAAVVAAMLALLLVAPATWASPDARPRHERHVPRGRAKRCGVLRRAGRRPSAGWRLRPRRRQQLAHGRRPLRPRVRRRHELADGGGMGGPGADGRVGASKAMSAVAQACRSTIERLVRLPGPVRGAQRGRKFVAELPAPTRRSPRCPARTPVPRRGASRAGRPAA